MSERPFDAEAYVAAMTPTLALAVREEWRAPVTAHVAAIAAAADLILSFPLSDEAEPAPVFEP